MFGREGVEIREVCEVSAMQVYRGGEGEAYVLILKTLNPRQ